MPKPLGLKTGSADQLLDEGLHQIPHHHTKTYTYVWFTLHRYFDEGLVQHTFCRKDDLSFIPCGKSTLLNFGEWEM